MTPRLRSAIIGTGFMGHVHARAVRAAGGDVAWAISPSPDRARAAAGSMAAERSASAWVEAVNDPEVDIIHVCTPNHLHAEISRAAIGAGKHVVCEKPLALGVADADDLVDRAEEAGVVAAVPFVYRFYPTVRDARERRRRGDLGAVRLVHGSYLQDWLSRPTDANWRLEPEHGGPSRAFADIGVHWCDLAEFVTGDRIRRLSARALVVDRDGIASTEDGATITFETDLGALGSVVVSQVSPGRKNRLWLEVDGAHASIEFDQENPDRLWLGTRESATIIPRGAEVTTPGAERFNTLPVGHPMGYQDCFTSFIGDVHARIRGEEADGLPTFADGRRAADLTAAFLDAVHHHDWIEVDA